MVLQAADKDRVRTLLREAIPMMCRSGLQFQSNFEIEALVGITLDQDVFIVSIKETIKPDREEDEEEEVEAVVEDTNSRSVCSSVGPASPSSRTKRKRKRSKDSLAGKKSRAEAGDHSSSGESDNDVIASSPAASSRLADNNAVLALEETSLDTAYELNQTIADNTTTSVSARNTKHTPSSAPARVKQEVQDSDSDSNDLVVVKEEHAYNYGNNDLSGGGGGSVFPGGLVNTLQQASPSSFGLPQYHAANINSPDLHSGPSLDMSGQPLLQQQDPQQVFARHARLIHDPPGAAEQYECTVCGMRTPYRRSMHRHIRERHVNAPRICPACGKSYTREYRHRCGGAGAGAGGDAGAGSVGMLLPGSVDFRAFQQHLGIN